MRIAEDTDPDSETGPERTCIVTRQVGDPHRMIRFVIGPDGTVVPDIRARLPGRGAWATATAATVAEAVRRKAFTRAFKRQVVVDPNLSATVEEMLLKDALAALSLANKAGLVVAGAAKVEGALTGGTVKALLGATDGSPDGLRKMEALARRMRRDGGLPIPSLQIFASSQMDLALGRANVIHAALLVGGASDAVLQRAARLHHYRGAEAAQQAGLEADPVSIAG